MRVFAVFGYNNKNRISLMSEAVANVSESYGPRVPSVGEGIVSPPILKLHDRDCLSLESHLRIRSPNFQISCT